MQWRCVRWLTDSSEYVSQGSAGFRHVRAHCGPHLIPAELLSSVSTSWRNEPWSRVMGKICITRCYTTHLNFAIRPSLLYQGDSLTICKWNSCQAYSLLCFEIVIFSFPHFSSHIWYNVSSSAHTIAQAFGSQLPVAEPRRFPKRYSWK